MFGDEDFLCSQGLAPKENIGERVCFHAEKVFLMLGLCWAPLPWCIRGQQPVKISRCGGTAVKAVPRDVLMTETKTRSAGSSGAGWAAVAAAATVSSALSAWLRRQTQSSLEALPAASCGWSSDEMGYYAASEWENKTSHQKRADWQLLWQFYPLLGFDISFRSWGKCSEMVISFSRECNFPLWTEIIKSAI